jgi:hypothetical protein
MGGSSNALAELLAGKTPEAMYDALYAGRYLSAKGQDAPPDVLTLIKTLVLSSRQRALMPATLLQRLAAALAESGFLNEMGEQLASQDVTDERRK